MSGDLAEITRSLQRTFHALDWKEYGRLDDVFVPGARMPLLAADRVRHFPAPPIRDRRVGLKGDGEAG